ncbi:MAG: iron-sulfur cluster assembly scaffold protein [Candidatus Berkelbacteria bacterium]|nr:iron-sulfur cluster assembly scaffold protein [Candidatus Berkelbacteria bacterium]
MENLYSEKIMEHFRNPRNLGEIKGADGVGTVGNPNCGDVMRIFIKVVSRKLVSGKPEEYISDIKFQTLGCGAAIASSSIATELVKGKSLEEALKLTSKQIAAEMGKFPPAKYHCSILAEEGVRKAIKDYRKKIKQLKILKK